MCAGTSGTKSLGRRDVNLQSVLTFSCLRAFGVKKRENERSDLILLCNGTKDLTIIICLTDLSTTVKWLRLKTVK